MSRPLRIEDLVVWKLACEFEAGVIALLRASPAASRDFRFASQLGDATSSVPANVAEGFYRYNGAEFAQFLRYARASLAESEKRLETGVRLGYWRQEDLTAWLTIAHRLGPAIRGLHNALKSKGKGGKGVRGVSK